VYNYTRETTKSMGFSYETPVFIEKVTHLDVLRLNREEENHANY